MRCHAMVRQIQRDVRLTACLWVALATLGCAIPAVTFKIDPVPFQDQDLEFLEPGSTDLETLIDELGPAPIVRRDGRLQVYAALVNRSVVYELGTGGNFKYHYLVLELDGHDIVQRFEVARPKSNPLLELPKPTCTSWGVCVLRGPFDFRGGGYFGRGDQYLPAGSDIAVVAETADADALAEDFLPGDHECALFLYNAHKSGAVYSFIRVATEETRWRDVPEGAYIRLTPPPGRQLIRASFGPDCEVKDIETFELDCEPAHSYFISLAGNKCSKIKITLEPEAIASETLLNRLRIVS